MKINKNKITISIFLVLFLVLNFNFVYLKLDKKEKLLSNQIKVIKKLENEKEEKLKNRYREDVVISMQKQFKDIATIKYIKTDLNSNNEIELEGEINGDRNLIYKSIESINKSKKKISVDSINITKMDENIIDCKFKVKVI
ncbi:hypothetical protein ANS017_00480 [Paraclostridium bifermentans]|uniref:hypothetical protein n=1 Tax=Paraclostridium TaxID=1849822 RepID=UPI001CC4B012|nr:MULTISPECIES: hypothetical protein [Paraclostridium]MBZ6005440.1 hypothetical protein [Paraclostridium bifermentans]MCR1876502.1 hypothetical protein [Paraclostridium bifermentans]MDU0296553.1 hypothetical protein [Paraclostridium sp. MRS3W1]GKZ02414.1 hypothetical protein ANS014_08480 [Paraclostridium bifermentans]GKZ05865.1 hypothetical protein ANS015_07480 [Paraclostridium bifermentans]